MGSNKYATQGGISRFLLNDHNRLLTKINNVVNLTAVLNGVHRAFNRLHRKTLRQRTWQ